MNEVVVTVLPHPVTMFFLGGILLGLILLYFEFRRTREEVKNFRKEISVLKDQIELFKDNSGKAIQEISRKVDSRIDKALNSTKK